MKSDGFFSIVISAVMINLLILMTWMPSETSAADKGTESAGYASVSAVHYSAFSAMKTKDYLALAEIVHPVKGVRFSINGYVNPKSDIVLKKSQLKKEAIGKHSFKWGTEGGSGNDILLTLDKFMDRFNKDFENPIKSGHNKRVTTAGISDPAGDSIRVIEGGEKIYAKTVFEESFFRGKSGLEFDWESFIMVFENHKGNYYLVGVIHNYWLV